MKFKKIINWFLIWRLALLLVAFLAIKLIPYRSGYLGVREDLYFRQPLLWGWANFDGLHYLTIAQYGYLQFKQAFFPFYPYLIRFFAKIIDNYLISGLLISHLSFLGSLFLFYRLVSLDFKKVIAQRSLLYLLLFPTAFYFGGLYSESLFLMFVLGSFYAARKKNWLLAGILGAMASATRFVGIFLFPALLVEWWRIKKKNKNAKISNFLAISFIAFGLLIYMWYLQKTMGDPFYFIRIQSMLETGRTGGKIVLFYQVLWRYFKMILTTKADILYFSVWLEFLTTLLFMILTIFSYFRFKLTYVIFMFLSFLTPTLTGTFSSMPRYVLVLFPGFILLAVWAEKKRWLRIVYPVFAIILSIISVMLFIRGYWVA